MKIFSASAFCLLVAGHPHHHHHHQQQEVDPVLKAAIAQMDPFSMSLQEVFVLGKLLRKGTSGLSHSRLNAAFAGIEPSQTELEAFYNLQQILLRKATNMDEARLALVGLDKSTVVDPSFFSEQTRLDDIRRGEMVRANIDREIEQEAMKGPVQLKSGEDTERPQKKSKGLQYFLDVRNMGFDQQWKIGEWFKLHPTARLTQRRLNNLLKNERTPTIQDLSAFHAIQQRALRGEIDNPWAQRMMETLWRNLTPDPVVF